MRSPGKAVLVLLALATAAPAAPPERRAAKPDPPRSARAELEALQRSVDTAVSRVARPSAAHLTVSRAYALAGYGAVIVLAPRAVTTRVVRSPRLDPVVEIEEARRSLEQGLARAESPEVRRQIEKSLERLRTTERTLRRQRPTPVAAQGFLWRSDEDGATLTQIDLEGMEEALQAQLAAQAEALGEMERRHQEWSATREAEVRAQLDAVHQNVEALRRDADRARERMERDVRVRLARPPAAETSSPPVPPLAPEGLLAPEAPVPPEFPAPPDGLGPLEPPPPPWAYWFEFSTEQPLMVTNAPEEVITRVKAAMVLGLERHRGGLSSMRPEDSISVAVDFMSGSARRARPGRTLVARVKVKDLVDRTAGRLGAEEFRRRVAYDEY